MKRDSDGHLIADATGRRESMEKKLDFSDRAPGDWTHYLLVNFDCDIFDLYTDDGTPITAFRVRGGSVSLNLFERLANGNVGALVESHDFEDGLRKLKVRPGDIDPIFNCHGYCFGDSEYWIDNNQVDKILRGDNYSRSVRPDETALIVYRRGQEAVHTAIRRLDSSGQVIYFSKAGVRGLELTGSLASAARTISFTDSVSYRYPY